MTATTHFQVRGALIRTLMAGEATAGDALARTVPAVEVLGLLVPIDGLTERYLGGRDVSGLEVTRHDFEPWRRRLVAAVAEMLERRIGYDPEAWSALVARAGAFQGSVRELIESAARPGPDASPPKARRAPRWPRGVDASAVLLSMAPPWIAQAFLADCATNEASAGILTRMLDRGPLLPLFVEYAESGSGSDAMLAALARNPAYGVMRLRTKVLHGRDDIEVLERAYVSRGADRALRIGCVRLAEAAGGFRPRFRARLESQDQNVPVLEPLLASGDPELVHWVLRRVNGLIQVPALRWAGYATLARTAGPEPVWALEQERAGTLARMAEPVRASMSGGSVAPILAAAEAHPVVIGPAGSAMELGAPEIEPWPYTELIAEYADDADAVAACAPASGSAKLDSARM